MKSSTRTKSNDKQRKFNLLLVATLLWHQVPNGNAFAPTSLLNNNHCHGPSCFPQKFRPTGLNQGRPLPSISSSRRKKSTVQLHYHHHIHSLLDPVTQGIATVVAAGSAKFLSRWRTYSLIPFIAGIVGWVTNYLAVKMIFYPIKWRGIPLWTARSSSLSSLDTTTHSQSDDGIGPALGLGWQGIVPAKTAKMSEAMVNATVKQLIKMEEIVQRLDPQVVADLLLPQAPKILGPLVEDLFFRNATDAASNDSDGSSSNQNNSPLREWVLKLAYTPGPVQERFCRTFLIAVTKDIQRYVNEVLNLRNCVVNQTMADRSLLGKLFQIAGRKELAFLVDSGLWFGFLLGLIQLFVSLVSDNPWTLSFGGLVVGLATNWLALKWIFEPVNPTHIVGNLYLQGLFLRRQKEVSADFSNFFSTKILTSEQLWHSILTDPSTAPTFESIWATNLEKMALSETRGLIEFEKADLQFASKRATARIYPLLADLHPYVDEALDIETTLRTRMMGMTSEEFERVLHPIFEEDEMTLIVAGGGLGFVAGLIQQGLAVGTLPLLPQWLLNGLATGGIAVGAYSIYFASRTKLDTFRRRIFKRLRDPSKVAFDAIDSNGNGYLEPREISRVAQILGIDLSEEELSQAFDELDQNHDGRVSLEEFEDWWNNDLGTDFHRKLAKELGLLKRRSRTRRKWSRMKQRLKYRSSLGSMS
ncbi:expressed unknown protein [Seminavis robusta]|uniref:EF-hand domain-containing protein n=1 Tax=Seminavis robusta TaxID=568900 RepID=A0A9N8DP76_9STRA|nr:expressed unknown protein [Seminavis robusta]|eukprot:Sro194_g082690.1 n/a (700) ;mRNA; r:11845-14192